MVSLSLFHFCYDKVILWVRFGIDGVLGYGIICQTSVRIKLQVWLVHVWLSDLNIQVGSPIGQVGWVISDAVI